MDGTLRTCRKDALGTTGHDQHTCTTRSLQAKAAAAPGSTKQQQRNSSRQQRQADVIMLDVSNSMGSATASSSEEDSDSSSPRLQLRLDSRLAAAADASDCEKVVISGSEAGQADTVGSSSEEEEETDQRQQQEEQVIPDSEEEVGEQVIPDSEAGDEEQQESSSESEAEEPAAAQPKARSARGTKQAPAAAAAATPRSRSSRTCNKTAPAQAEAAAAAKAAMTTPKRNRRSAAASAAAGGEGGGSLTPAPAKAAAPASGRPVHSCTKAGAAQPSLATPLARLSLTTPVRTPRRNQHTPAPAAAAGSSRKGRGRAAGGRSSSGEPAVGDRLPSVEVGGEVLVPGDDVYLMEDEYDPDEEQEEEACEVCHSSHSSRANALLECSTCLRGFHQRCLDPPLRAVPEGDWLCPACNAGQVPPPPARLLTRWQKLLHGSNQLALVHVVDCRRGRAPDGTEEDQLVVRYYKLPQETHLGRQRHHGAREVFLACQTFIEPAQAVMGRAFVRPPARFWQSQEGEGNDVYLCEFEYNEGTKTFKARRPGSGSSREPGELLSGVLGPAAAAAGAASAAGGGSSRRRRRQQVWGSGSGSDADYSSEEGLGSGDGECDDFDVDDECGDESYRPELAWRPGAMRGGKRRCHGRLPAAAAADRFAGLGASDIAAQRGEQQQQRDAYSRLHAALSLAAVPASLPCREGERSRLTGFVSRALKEDGGILYICGVPGTGKTALVMEVLGSLQASAVAAGAQFVALNCLQLPSPQHVFTRLWDQLSGQHLGPARAREALMHMFGVSGGVGGGPGSSRRRFSTVIVLDEIDMLMTRDQAVLYQLFDWPHQPGSRLAVVGISNTHDLDQRVLPRIASRLDEAKLAFAPYSVQQLLTIVGERLAASGVAGAVDDVAVQQACRKVASETGDVRRALELLRRAVEIARQERLTAESIAAARGGAGSSAAAAGGSGQHRQQLVMEWTEGSPSLVKRTHVHIAQQEMFGALHIKLLRSRSLWEMLLLVAVVVEARASGRSAVMMQHVAERASSSICQLVDLAPPSLGVLQHCLVKLAGVRLLLSDGAHVKANVVLNVDKDDVAFVIRDDERLTRLHQLL